MVILQISLFHIKGLFSLGPCRTPGFAGRSILNLMPFPCRALFIKDYIAINMPRLTSLIPPDQEMLLFFKRDRMLTSHRFSLITEKALLLGRLHAAFSGLPPEQLCGLSFRILRSAFVVCFQSEPTFAHFNQNF